MNQEIKEFPSYEVELNASKSTLHVSLRGRWRLQYLQAVDEEPQQYPAETVILDSRDLLDLDTAGARVILNKVEAFAPRLKVLTLKNFDSRPANVFNLVRERTSEIPPTEEDQTAVFGDQIFRSLFSAIRISYERLCLLGQLFAQFFMLPLLSRKRFRLNEIVIELERDGIRAIPIISLVTFLIGLVVAYLFASQAQKYGANALVVDAVGMGMCRELSPLIVAIIVAGRSGSAFTAQIGTMKLNKEIDAIRTLGLSPFNVLVLPRVLALVLSIPFLVLVGDFFGIMGGLLVAHFYLEVPPDSFLNRLREVLALRHVYLGLAKAPVFALIISLIACHLGLKVEDNARSVGLNTTSTVVQSIVSVILLNAGFAVLFQELGW